MSKNRSYKFECNEHQTEKCVQAYNVSSMKIVDCRQRVIDYTATPVTVRLSSHSPCEQGARRPEPSGDTAVWSRDARQAVNVRNMCGRLRGTCAGDCAGSPRVLKTAREFVGSDRAQCSAREFVASDRAQCEHRGHAASERDSMPIMIYAAGASTQGRKGKENAETCNRNYSTAGVLGSAERLAWPPGEPGGKAGQL